MPPTDPLIYRFYELVMVNGPALQVLIEEEFGDGIMSAIDFDLAMERPGMIPRAIGSKSRCRENSCRTNITARPAMYRLTATRKSKTVVRPTPPKRTRGHAARIIGDCDP